MSDNTLKLKKNKVGWKKGNSKYEKDEFPNYYNVILFVIDRKCEEYCLGIQI